MTADWADQRRRRFAALGIRMTLGILSPARVPCGDKRHTPGPFVEEGDYFFPKTIIPSRKATRDYLNQGEADAEN